MNQRSYAYAARQCGLDDLCSAQLLRGAHICRCPRCDAVELGLQLMADVPSHVTQDSKRRREFKP